MPQTSDGSELLTGDEAGELLRSAVSNAGGVLHSWDLDHVDHRPERSTKALYRTRVSWPEIDGPDAAPRDEMFGASAHIGEPEKEPRSTEQSILLTDGDIAVRVWRYPHDPWLPMLASVCFPDTVAGTLEGLGVRTGAAPGQPVPIEVVSYRPGRRAVLKADLPSGTVYLKVMQPTRSGEIVERHAQLRAAGVPVPEVLAHHDGLVVLASLPGIPLAQAVVEQGTAAARPEDLVALVDRLPASMFTLPLRAPWTDSAEFYAGMVSAALPALAPRIDALVRAIRDGLADVAQRLPLEAHDVVHGDFYESQVFVEDGAIVGLLDIDTVGPGRRADDLACMLAHMSVLADGHAPGRIARDVHDRVAEVVADWTRVFDERVDPQELALRAAGVVLSLATGPHRQQEDSWELATEAILSVAEQWALRARDLSPALRARTVPSRPSAPPAPAGPGIVPAGHGAPAGPGTVAGPGPGAAAGGPDTGTPAGPDIAPPNGAR